MEARDSSSHTMPCDTQSVLFSLVYQEGESSRWGRRSDLGWNKDLLAIKDNAEMTLFEVEPVAAVTNKLSLPRDCQKDLLKYLKALGKDPRKTKDVRDMREMALVKPSMATELNVARHPNCGIVQFCILFRFRGGRCKDWFSNVDPTVVTQVLQQSLEAWGFKSDSISIKFDLERDDIGWGSGRRCTWWVVIRTENGAKAHALKEQLEAADFCNTLRTVVPIRSLLQANDDDDIAYKGTSGGLSQYPSTFNFETNGEIRVIGGRILDIIDPCRASIDPSTTSPLGAPPRWIPALVAEANDIEIGAEANLHFVSEVSGIPWMGQRTLANPLYHRLAQVLTAMRGLFTAIGRPLTDEMRQHAKVLVKAQAYVLRTGDEILGQLHQEGVPTDRIESVGLYYPEVDETLIGGDLDITVVMTGGCGAKYPVSKSIPITSGTAVVFDNLTAYHRMTSLKCKGCEHEGNRFVLGFFVLRADDENTSSPSSEDIHVNYADKAGAMVRLATKYNAKKLAPNVHANIVAHLAGDFQHVQREFHLSRSARSKPVTREGLSVMACD